MDNKALHVLFGQRQLGTGTTFTLSVLNAQYLDCGTGRRVHRRFLLFGDRLSCCYSLWQRLVLVRVAQMYVGAVESVVSTQSE